MLDSMITMHYQIYKNGYFVLVDIQLWLDNPYLKNIYLPYNCYVILGVNNLLY